MTRRPVRPRRGGRGGRSDEGSATILVVAGLGVLMLLLLSALGVGAAVTASHRARGAADLGALAGAVSIHAGLGTAAACARAGAMVARNAAQLVSCEVDDEGAVLVTVSAPVTGPVQFIQSLGWPGAGTPMAKARSRAGPSP
ncbi:Rv3654c family TadE-like protein [Pedococcus sp.]|uniref:Rv3654c family TadE-like protein n=1 Tax=Pedococcus sp. TaxID=2860345 RepID=UPI002E162E36|nr:Rv3654c family TadE-like protein [Pedococcus sp.]